jgi:hypothetical protein
VVQEAAANGINVYNCSTLGGARCFVVQLNKGILGASRARSGAVSSNAATPAPGSNNMQVNCQQNGGSASMLDASSCYSGTQVNTNGNNQATIQQSVQQQNMQSSSATEDAGYPTGCAPASGTGSPQTPLFQQNLNGNNQITIQQQAQQQQIDTPTATQQAVVCQSNLTGNNQATIQQKVQQQVNDASSLQDQEATQFACVVQDSSSGQNQATVQQQQQQNEQTSAAQSGSSAQPVTEYQDQYPGTNNSCGNGSPDRTETTYPNLGAVIEQNESSNPPTGSGQDQATVDQQWQENQQSAAQSGAVTQQQGPCCSGAGGSETDANQYSTGVAQANVHQADQQQQDAKTSGARNQSQYDAPHCCSNQSSNPKDQFTVAQQTVQNSDPGASQNYYDNGDCTSSGACSVNQTVNQDGQNESPPPCNNQPSCEVDSTNEQISE